MSRHIDADALEEKAKQYSLGYYEADEWAVPLCEISEAPSIDIVRCKECKHRYNDGWIEPRWTCDYLKDMRLKDDDYCSYGERKESE